MLLIKCFCSSILKMLSLLISIENVSPITLGKIGVTEAQFRKTD